MVMLTGVTYHRHRCILPTVSSRLTLITCVYATHADDHVIASSIDLSPSSQHIKRRIWQEAISTLFLTEPECSIPETQLMLFAQTRDVTVNYPPYLLNFEGSPAERHVENLKASGFLRLCSAKSCNGHCFVIDAIYFLSIP